MSIYHNQESFQPEEFGTDRFLRKSKVRRVRFNPREPRYQIIKTAKAELQDEIDYV